jgi:type I restriction enzyme R subunit
MSKKEAGDNTETIELIDWKHPHKNHFAITEEVTVHGKQDKRPDIVLYVKSLALGVLELKRSTTTIGDGINIPATLFLNY